jgi:hypothetical protein
MRTSMMSADWRWINRTMSSASTWIAADAPGRCHGTAILHIQAAIERRRETQVTRAHAEEMVERQRTLSAKATPSGQELIRKEIENPDERDEHIEVPVMQLLVLNGLLQGVL